MIKNIVGYERYTIDRLGNIYDLIKNKRIKLYKSKSMHYITTSLIGNDGNRKHVYLHRMLALTFIKNEMNKPCINHIDGVKTNNLLSNLEWVTQKENIQKAWESGLCKNLPSNTGIKCEINGVEYPSHLRASIELGCSIYIIRKKYLKII